MKRSFAFGAIISLIATVPAVAQVGPGIAFDATYQTSDGGTMHMLSDGAGHMRTEVGVHGHNAINLIDFPNHTMNILMPERKTAMQMAMRADQETIADEQSAKTHNAKPIGAKVVDGHPCHGWQYTNPRGTSIVWIGDDIHFMVRTETTAGDHVTTMDLQQFSNAAPPAVAFTVPSDYRVMSMPTRMPSLESLKQFGSAMGGSPGAGMQQIPQGMPPGMMQNVSRMMGQRMKGMQGMPNGAQFMQQGMPPMQQGNPYATPGAQSNPYAQQGNQ